MRAQRINYRRQRSIDTASRSLNDINAEHENVTGVNSGDETHCEVRGLGGRFFRVTQLSIERHLAIRCGERPAPALDCAVGSAVGAVGPRGMAMAATREGAIAHARAGFDDGSFIERLRALVAVPTESHPPLRKPELERYCRDVCGPM